MIRFLFTGAAVVLASLIVSCPAQAQLVDSTSSEFLNSELAKKDYFSFELAVEMNWLLDPQRRYSVGEIAENSTFINGAQGPGFRFQPGVIHRLSDRVKISAEASLYADVLSEFEQHRIVPHQDNFTESSYEIDEAGIGLRGSISVALFPRVFFETSIGCETTVGGSFLRQAYAQTPAAPLVPVLTKFRLIVAGSGGFYIPLPYFRWMRIRGEVGYSITPYFKAPVQSSTPDLYRPSILRVGLSGAVLLPFNF